MAMTYKPSMSKAELLKIAAENGVQTDDGMTKAEILAALDGAGGETPDGAGTDTSPEETAQPAQQTAQDGAGRAEDGEGTEDTTEQEQLAEDAQEAPEGYGLFVYAGPPLPRGRLKENAVFNGTFEDVKAYRIIQPDGLRRRRTSQSGRRVKHHGWGGTPRRCERRGQNESV